MACPSPASKTLTLHLASGQAIVGSTAYNNCSLWGLDCQFLIVFWLSVFDCLLIVFVDRFWEAKSLAEYQGKWPDQRHDAFSVWQHWIWGLCWADPPLSDADSEESFLHWEPQCACSLMKSQVAWICYYYVMFLFSEDILLCRSPQDPFHLSCDLWHFVGALACCEFSAIRFAIPMNHLYIKLHFASSDVQGTWLQCGAVIVIFGAEVEECSGCPERFLWWTNGTETLHNYIQTFGLIEMVK